MGTYRFGEHAYAKQDEINAVRCAQDCGISVFDTAAMYADGEAENVLGQALKGGPRDQAHLITKINPWDANVSKTRHHCEQSLKRLQTDRIDLFLVHWRGPVPLDETVEALTRLLRDGLILDWGVSNFDRSDLQELKVLRDPSLPPMVNQVLYNPLRRAAEPRLLAATFSNVRWMAYSPFERDRPFDWSAFEPIAARQGCTVHAVVLAWIRLQGFQPVFKAAQVAHVKANAVAYQVDFLPEELLAIELAHPAPGEPPCIERDDTV